MTPVYNLTRINRVGGLSSPSHTTVHAIYGIRRFQSQSHAVSRAPLVSTPRRSHLWLPLERSIRNSSLNLPPVGAPIPGSLFSVTPCNRDSSHGLSLIRPFPAKGRVLWPLPTPCLRASARHPFRPWQGLTEYEYATFLPRRLHLPHGLMMMYRISALLATSSVHLAIYAVSVRAVGIFPRTSFPTLRCLPAVALGAPLAP